MQCNVYEHLYWSLTDACRPSKGLAFPHVVFAHRVGQVPPHLILIFLGSILGSRSPGIMQVRLFASSLVADNLHPQEANHNILWTHAPSGVLHK